jgi:hypothetical protein
VGQPSGAANAHLHKKAASIVSKGAMSLAVSPLIPPQIPTYYETPTVPSKKIPNWKAVHAAPGNGATVPHPVDVAKQVEDSVELTSEDVAEGLDEVMDASSPQSTRSELSENKMPLARQPSDAEAMWSMILQHGTPPSSVLLDPAVNAVLTLPKRRDLSMRSTL